MSNSITQYHSNGLASYLALDPGDVIGWCTFAEDGSLLAMGQIDSKDLVTWSAENLTSSLKAVICEDYVLFKHKAMAQTNSRGRNLSTAKQVGKIELLCELKNVPFIKQPAANYPIGAMWGGFEIPSNHSISHQYCAAAHGIFYLQKNGIRKPSIAKKVT